MNHLMSDPPPHRSSRWREPSTGASKGRSGDANPVDTTRIDDIIWFSVRYAAVSVTIHGPLPERWTILFLDFRKRMRRIPLGTRRELVRHMWRQFAELRMVDVLFTQSQSGQVGRRVKETAAESDAQSAQRAMETAGSPLFSVSDAINPDEILRVLYMVSRAVRRRTRWQW